MFQPSKLITKIHFDSEGKNKRPELKRMKILRKIKWKRNPIELEKKQSEKKRMETKKCLKGKENKQTRYLEQQNKTKPVGSR